MADSPLFGRRGGLCFWNIDEHSQYNSENPKEIRLTLGRRDMERPSSAAFSFHAALARLQAIFNQQDVRVALYDRHELVALEPLDMPAFFASQPLPYNTHQIHQLIGYGPESQRRYRVLRSLLNYEDFRQAVLTKPFSEIDWAAFFPITDDRTVVSDILAKHEAYEWFRMIAGNEQLRQKIAESTRFERITISDAGIVYIGVEAVGVLQADPSAARLRFVPTQQQVLDMVDMNSEIFRSLTTAPQALVAPMVPAHPVIPDASKIFKPATSSLNPLQQRILGTAQRALRHIEQDHWLTSVEGAELATVLRNFLAKNNPVLNAEHPNAFAVFSDFEDAIQFGAVAWENMSDEEAEAMLLRTFSLMRPSNQLRVAKSLELIPGLPRTSAEFFDEEKSETIKQWLALRVQNEFEAYRVMLAVWTNYARLARRPLLEYFTWKERHAHDDNARKMFQRWIQVIGAATSFETLEDALRMKFAYPAVLSSDMREAFESMTEDQTGYVHDRDIHNTILSWLKDPAYYNVGLRRAPGSLTLGFIRARLAKNRKVIASAQQLGMDLDEYIEIYAAPKHPVEIILSLLPGIFVALHGFGSWKIFRTRLIGQFRMSSPFWILTFIFVRGILYPAMTNSVPTNFGGMILAYLVYAALSIAWNIDEHSRHNSEMASWQTLFGFEKRFYQPSSIPPVQQEFETQLNDALDGKDSSLSALETFGRQPTGKEKGRFISINWGGTNAVVMLVDLFGKGRYKAGTKKEGTKDDFAFDQVDKENPATAFDKVVNSIVRLVGDDKTTPMRIGFIFSFKMEQTSLRAAILRSWSKGWRDPETGEKFIGRDPGKVLQDRLHERGYTNIAIGALANDTLNPMIVYNYKLLGRILIRLLAFIYKFMGREFRAVLAFIGSILGTGHNTAVQIGDEIFNLESGNFNGVLDVQSIVDMELDKEVKDPASGAQMLEKMVSSKYLPEVLRRVMIRLNQQYPETFTWTPNEWLNIPFQLEGGHLAAFANDRTFGLRKTRSFFKSHDMPLSSFEAQTVQRLSRLIMRRSADLMAAHWAAIIHKRDPEFKEKHVIPVEGSLFTKNPLYQRYVNQELRRLLGWRKAWKIKFASIDGAEGVGAAILAAMTEPEPEVAVDLLAMGADLDVLHSAGKGDPLGFDLRRANRNQDGSISREEALMNGPLRETVRIFPMLLTASVFSQLVAMFVFVHWFPFTEVLVKNMALGSVVGIIVSLIMNLGIVIAVAHFDHRDEVLYNNGTNSYPTRPREPGDFLKILKGAMAYNFFPSVQLSISMSAVPFLFSTSLFFLVSVHFLIFGVALSFPSILVSHVYWNKTRKSNDLIGTSLRGFLLKNMVGRFVSYLRTRDAALRLVAIERRLRDVPEQELSSAVQQELLNINAREGKAGIAVSELLSRRAPDLVRASVQQPSKRFGLLMVLQLLVLANRLSFASMAPPQATTVIPIPVVNNAADVAMCKRQLIAMQQLKSYRGIKLDPSVWSVSADLSTELKNDVVAAVESSMDALPVSFVVERESGFDERSDGTYDVRTLLRVANENRVSRQTSRIELFDNLSDVQKPVPANVQLHILSSVAVPYVADDDALAKCVWFALMTGLAIVWVPMTRILAVARAAAKMA